jgi:NADPH-dependent glutamate synthase beta subunit-like oxidoreductase
VGFTNEGKRINDLAITRWSTIDNDPEILQANIPYIFTAGDAATGASLVVEAIGGGRRAARSIHRYLMGETIEAIPNSLRKRHIPESLFKVVPGVMKSARTPMPELPVGERIQSFVESDLVIAEKDALYESARCLSCCRICYNKDENTACAA